jgi:hypothetical protein
MTSVYITAFVQAVLAVVLAILLLTNIKSYRSCKARKLYVLARRAEALAWGSGVFMFIALALFTVTVFVGIF